ncbi:hypothetical protein [Actinoplanes sp. NBRC 101535]|uniref:hypothetical protein n=1 Tax=Actinoplanes sp. NBRC 101535 TaxID=3032196 RepID=UPI0024A4A33F|nr:hypothetical protein [Actinoplanes sp. NBRC 101535]GLY05516.1 hypothetical protein Acsp01_58950 [Actinoplanes sp. NBRC 101535]
MSTEALHHTIFMIDVQGSGKLPNPAKLAMRETLYAAVGQALSSAGITDGIRLEDRGDGILGTATAAVPKIQLIGTGIQHLYRALQLADGPPLKFRIGLHGGEVDRDTWGISGSDVDLACRLADAPVVRRTLETATAAPLAVVVSEQLFDSVVRHGGHQLHPEQWARVDVKVKEVDRRAWLYVPGYSTPPIPPQSPSAPTAPTPLGSRQFTFNGPSAYVERSTVHGLHVGPAYHLGDQ